MKSILVITILFIITSGCQRFDKKVEAIRITKEYYTSQGERRSLEEFSFDSKGNILQNIIFGSQKNKNDFNLIVSKDQYFYENGKLVLRKELSISENNDFEKTYTKYKYDGSGKLLNDKLYTINDSLIFSRNYKYKKNIIETHFGPHDAYLQKKYNIQKRLIEYNQIDENSNKIRWQHKYNYINNCRLDNFQYFISPELSTNSITYYDSKKRIVSRESKTDSEKTDLIYDNNGIVSKIIFTHLNQESNKFEEVEVVKFTYNNHRKLGEQAIKTINEELTNNELCD